MISRFIISVGVLTSLTIPLLVRAEVRPIVFPVSGPSVFRDDFLEPRGGGTRQHLGVDIIADKMTPLLSAVDGVVNYIVSPQASWGYEISIADSEGYQYRYLHVNNDTPGTDDGLGGETNAYAPGIRRGVRVIKGQFIGWVGDSGNAEETIPHLHFEIRAPGGAAINPYDSLRAVTSGAMAVFTQDISVSKVVIAIPKDYILIKYANDPTIFLLSQNIKYKILNTGTLAMLGKSAADARVIPDNEQYPTGSSISIASTITTDDSSTGDNFTGPLTPADLSEGSKGPAVVELQTVLKSLGYFTVSVTDYFGPITKAAVVKFQTDKGINDLIGVVGPKTRAALGLTYVTPAPTTALVPITFSVELHEGSSGDAVRQLQTALKNLGFFPAAVTDYFGPITKAAVINFQIAKGIDPIGIVGPKTRAALGLGGTAIAAAPIVGVPTVQSGLLFRLQPNSSVTVIGSINANGSPTTYWYEYGDTQALGSRTVSRDLGPLGATSTSAGLYITGLYPNTTYYIRLVAENKFGTAHNTTYSFQTEE
jgi:peptidoglycan hydrolase-like protein with peptidoglycan-binding domain